MRGSGRTAPRSTSGLSKWHTSGMSENRPVPASMRRERLARRARWLLGAVALAGMLYRIALMYR